ncbi:hypothetical protein [Nocardia cyriacigeorgica]|nr:hypothetical protein [Nocardia cyriacigeorgica]
MFEQAGAHPRWSISEALRQVEALIGRAIRAARIGAWPGVRVSEPF